MKGKAEFFTKIVSIVAIILGILAFIISAKTGKQITYLQNRLIELSGCASEARDSENATWQTP